MRLIPREEKFFDYFEELADKIEEGGNLFLEILEDYENSRNKIAKMKVIEHEADHITHKTYEKMHKTFLTPIDREDIYALVNKMDSILDMTESAAARMHLYKVKHPCVEILDQIRVLNQAVAKIKKIVHAMRNMKNAEMILKACVEINTLENEGDAVLRTAVANLFERESDALEVIKKKEILERLEEAIDACEDVSNIVEGIVLKNA